MRKTKRDTDNTKRREMKQHQQQCSSAKKLIQWQGQRWREHTNKARASLSLHLSLRSSLSFFLSSFCLPVCISLSSSFFSNFIPELLARCFARRNQDKCYTESHAYFIVLLLREEMEKRGEEEFEECNDGEVIREGEKKFITFIPCSFSG